MPKRDFWRELSERLRIIWMSEPECVKCSSCRDCILEEIQSRVDWR